MAGDVSLLFDVAGGGTLSGDSGAEIQKQLNSIVSEINKSPFKIKFQADEESLSKMREAVQKITESFGNVRLGSVSVDTGSVTRGIANGVQKITEGATKAASAVGKITASLDESKVSSAFGKMTASLENNIETIERDIAKINGVTESDAKNIANLFTNLGVQIDNVSAKIKNVGSDSQNVVKMVVSGTKTSVDGAKTFVEQILTLNKKTKELELGDMNIDIKNAKELKEVIREAGKETEKLSSDTVAMFKEIDVSTSKITSGYKKISDDKSISNLDEIRAKYQQLIAKVDEFKSKGNAATATEANEIHNLQSELSSLLAVAGNVNTDFERSKQMFKDLSVTLDEISVKSLDSFNQKYNNVFGIQDTSGFNAKLAQLENVRKVINEIIIQGNREITLPKFDSNGRQIDEYRNLEEILNRIGYRLEEINDLDEHSRVGHIVPIIDKEQVYSVEDAIRALSELIGLKNEFDGMSSVKVAKWSSIETLGEKLNDSKNKIRDIIAELDSLSGKYQGSDARVTVEGGDKLLATDAISELRKRLNEYVSTVLSAETKQVDFDNTLKDSNNELKDIKYALSEGEKAFARFNKSEKENLKDSNSLSKAIVATNRAYKQATEALQKYTAAKNGKSSKQYAEIEQQAAALKNLEERLHSGTISEREYVKATNEARAKIQEATAIIKANGEAHLSLADKIKVTAEKFSQYFGIAKAVNLAWRATRQMVQATIELDDAFTQLKIVTGATDSEMEKFSDTAIKLSKSLGQSVADVTKSIETFSRLGYNLPDASKLAEYATILANTAAVSTDEATTGLTSIIKGYNLDISDAEHVSDVLIQVGQRYAVSAGELMEAFERSGAALNATNVSFEKSAGLIAAANAAVQNSSTVGTALKTISARIRGSKTDLEELGEDTEDLAEGFSKYAKELEALTNVNIMVEGSTTDFKDPYDIMNEIAQVWDTLSDTSQARVSEILGGTKQLQVIASILGNWKDATGAYADAMDSAGVATKANDTYMESATAHINQFKASFEELSSDILSSKLLGGIIDAGSTILGILDSISKLLGGLPGDLTGIAVAVSAALSFKNVGELINQFQFLIILRIEYAHEAFN